MAVLNLPEPATPVAVQDEGADAIVQGRRDRADAGSAAARRVHKDRHLRQFVTVSGAREGWHPIDLASGPDGIPRFPDAGKSSRRLNSRSAFALSGLSIPALGSPAGKLFDPAHVPVVTRLQIVEVE